MMTIGESFANPPAPGLLYVVIAETNEPGVYLELEIFDGFATLLHSFARVEWFTEATRCFEEMIDLCETWAGTVDTLPKRFVPPPWSAPQKRFDDGFVVDLDSVEPSNDSFASALHTPRSAMCRDSSDLEDAVSVASASLTGTPEPSRSISSLSVVAHPPSPVAQPLFDAPVVGAVNVRYAPFRAGYYRVEVAYELGPDAAIRRSSDAFVGARLLAVAVPHTYEPEAIRFVLRPSPSCGGGASRAAVARRVYQHRPFASSVPPAGAVARSNCDPVVLPDDVEVVLRTAAAMCAAFGWPTATPYGSFGSDSDGGALRPPQTRAMLTAPVRPPISSASSSDSTPKTAPTSVAATSLKPRNLVVDFGSGPRRRCFADVTREGFHGVAPQSGDRVVVCCPGAGPRLGVVVSTSSWSKRKAAANPAAPQYVAERIATKHDLHVASTDAPALAAAAAALARDFAAAHAAAAAAAATFTVIEAWATLDLCHVTVVVATPPARPAALLSNAQAHVAGQLGSCRVRFVSQQNGNGSDS